MTTRPLLLVVLIALLLLSACGGSGGSSEPVFPDTWRQDVGTSWGPRDTGGTTNPDAGSGDSGQRDTEPTCGNCPSDRPQCDGSACICTVTSCGAGRWCDGVRCQDCDTDEHCGATCDNCAARGELCGEDGGQCVSCQGDEDCESGFRCELGACYACNTSEHCGVDCIACPDDLPECAAGGCRCTEDSCPAGEWCSGTSCTACDTVDHCGFDCEDCRLTATPVCTGGLCRCATDDECGDGRWCNNGTCEDCADNDPLHCGLTCAVCEGSSPLCSGGSCVCSDNDDCGVGYWCDGQGCASCNDALHCGDDCEPCTPATPICHEGACVLCATNEDCDPANYCEAGACFACAADDPAHCGDDCALCEGGTPFCVDGGCTCDESSCGDYYRCADDSCLLCNDAAHCGASCGACEGATPYCAPDGSGCVACAEDAQCGAEEMCWNGNCVPDCSALGCPSAAGMGVDTCLSPQVIGRVDAIGGTSLVGSLDLQTNDDDRTGIFASCTNDEGRDNFYQIYLVPGDRLDVAVDVATSSHETVLKLYKGQGCDGSGAENVACAKVTGEGEDAPILPDQSFSYTADTLGWHVIVVDGAAWVQPGPAYTLDVTLTCPHAACCCYDEF